MEKIINFFSGAFGFFLYAAVGMILGTVANQKGWVWWSGVLICLAFVCLMEFILWCARKKWGKSEKH